MSEEYYGDPNRQGTPSLKALKAVHESRIQSYLDSQAHYRLTGRRARRDGDTETYERAVEALRRYDRLLANEREELRRLGD